MDVDKDAAMGKGILNVCTRCEKKRILSSSPLTIR